MALPLGTEFIIPLRINKSLMIDNLSDFLYQVDISSYINAAYTHFSGDETKISVYDNDTDTVLYKHADVRNVTNGKLFVYFNGPTSLLIDKTIYICFGSLMNYPNNSETFSTHGYTQYWGTNEQSGSSIESYVGTYTGTIVPTATLSTGIFSTGISAPGSGAGRISFSSEIIGNGDRTFEFLVNFIGAGPSSDGRLFTNTKSSIGINSTNRIVLTRNLVTYSQTALNSIVFNNWYHVTITSTSAGIANFYLNGVQSGSVNQNGGAPLAGTTNLMMFNREGYDRTANAYMDEIGFSSSILSLNYLKTRSNQALNSNFFSIGTPFVITGHKNNYVYGYDYNY